MFCRKWSLSWGGRKIAQKESAWGQWTWWVVVHIKPVNGGVHHKSLVPCRADSQSLIICLPVSQNSQCDLSCQLQVLWKTYLKKIRWGMIGKVTRSWPPGYTCAQSTHGHKYLP